MDLRALLIAFRDKEKQVTAERGFLKLALAHVKNFNEDGEDTFSYEGLEATSLPMAEAEIDSRLTALTEANKELETMKLQIDEAQKEANTRLSQSLTALDEMQIPQILSAERTPSHAASGSPVLVENAETGEKKFVLPAQLFSGVQSDAPQMGIGQWLHAETGGDFRKLVGNDSGIQIPLKEVALGHARHPETGRPIIQAAVGVTQIPTLRTQMEQLNPFMAANYFSDLLTVKTSRGNGLQWNEDVWVTTNDTPSSGEITTAVASDPNTIARQMYHDDGRLFTLASKRSLRMRDQWQNFIENKLDSEFRAHHSKQAAYAGSSRNGVIGLGNTKFTLAANNATSASNPTNGTFNGIVNTTFNIGGAASTDATTRAGLKASFFSARDALMKRSPATGKILALRRDIYTTWRSGTGNATGEAAQLANGLDYNIDGIPVIPIDIGFPANPTKNNDYGPIGVMSSFDSEESWMDISNAELIIKDEPETGQYKFILDVTYGYVWTSHFDYAVFHVRKIA